MSATLMDERYRENQIKAQVTADKVSLMLIFLATIVVGMGKIMMSLEFTLTAYLIAVTLSLALNLFLNEYLLYRYDHDEQIDE